MKNISIYLLFIFLIPIAVMGQEPHMRTPDSVEDLLRKSNPEEFEARVNHEKYLVIENIGSSKRKKIYIGQPISFENTEEQSFIGDLTRLTDSTMTITYFDNTSQRYEVRLFYISEIEQIHKRILEKGLNYSFSPLFFLPLVLDWAYFKRKPWENVNTLYYMTGIEAARILLTNRKKFFNTYKFNEKRRLRVFQY
jgi:hypothetical protein